jgi:hypothetical protein
MRISKKTRESAALICALAASTNVGSIGCAWAIGLHTGSHAARREYLAAIDLVSAAFDEAGLHPWTRDRFGRFDAQNWCAQMAEAEAMLRTGWSPNWSRG